MRGVPLGVRCYISSPLSGTRQKGCRAERNGGRRGEEKQKKGVRGDLITYGSGRRGMGEGGNALNDDNKEEGRRKGGRGLDRDIVLPGDEHICGKSA